MMLLMRMGEARVCCVFRAIKRIKCPALLRCLLIVMFILDVLTEECKVVSQRFQRIPNLTFIRLLTEDKEAAIDDVDITNQENLAVSEEPCKPHTK